MTANPETTEKPCSRPASVEMTPAEFDYCTRRAQEMRAEQMSIIIERCAAAAGRAWGRVKSAFGGRAPARLDSREAESRAA